MRSRIYLLGLALGCQANEWAPTFGAGGSQENASEGGDEGSWLDTAEDWGESDEEFAPVITEFRAAFEYYPTIGWVMEVSVGYSDQDGDLSGGFVHLTMKEEGGEDFEQVVPIDGQSAFIEKASVNFAVDQVDTDLSYDLEVYLEDEAGNASDVAQTVVEPS
jgi:hypothetical protein